LAQDQVLPRRQEPAHRRFAQEQDLLAPRLPAQLGCALHNFSNQAVRFSSYPLSFKRKKNFSQLDKIVQLAGAKPHFPALGLMTTEQRDESAKILQQVLDAHPSNIKALEAIESSIFAVCLDDTSPVSRNDAGRAIWHGDGRNRFFDKHVQFIVFENGKAGLNGEVLNS